MKLAEALLIRGNLQERLSALKTRLVNNALVQEGEKTAEDPAELLKETESVIRELENLITKINLTNAALLKDGQTMTALLSKRDALRMKIDTCRMFLDTASSSARRARGSEIKIKPSVDIPSLQKEIDSYSMELRNLEISIQELNWTNDLLD